MRGCYQPTIRRHATKSGYTCARCGKALLSGEAFQYVDGDNCSITQNAPILCHECYVAQYGNEVSMPPPTLRELLGKGKK